MLSDTAFDLSQDVKEFRNELDTKLGAAAGVQDKTTYDEMVVKYCKRDGKPIPALMQSTANLAKEYMNDRAGIGRQILSGVLESRIKVTELNLDIGSDDPPGKMTIQDAATVEWEMNQQKVQTGGEMQL